MICCRIRLHQAQTRLNKTYCMKVSHGLLKRYFKDAMKQTIDYTTKLCDYEVNLPLEQQICLMKASEAIKQKAMIKLKEVKSKNDESGTKARQWLGRIIKNTIWCYKTRTSIENYTKKLESHIMNYYKDQNPIKTIIL